MKKNTIQPLKVMRITCPECGELMVKIYPFSSITFLPEAFPKCRKCQAKIGIYRNLTTREKEYYTGSH